MNEKSQTTERTRTATTPHGDVEYRTVECSSCGQEVRREDARRFVMGDEKLHRPHPGHIEYRFKHLTVREGWACPYCVDSGPIGFPERARRAWPAVSEKDMVWLLLVFAAFIAAFELLFMVGYQL